MMNARDLLLAQRARRRGAHYSLRIIWEARRAGLRISVGFALIEQESTFRNIFGHDPTVFIGAGRVTRTKYRAYKQLRGTPGRHMQGVGPAQLTWWEFQDRADHIGGCHVPRCNIRVAFEDLAKLIEKHGYARGLERYNGSGVGAVAYSKAVRAKAEAWHERLA